MNTLLNHRYVFAIAIASMLGPMSSLAPAQFGPLPPAALPPVVEKRIVVDTYSEDLLKLDSAGAFLKKGQNTEAIELYRGFLKLHDDTDENDPDVNYAYSGLADGSVRVNHREQAIYALNQLSKWKPDNPAILDSRARCYLELEQVAMAIDELRRFLVLKPDGLRARILLAYILATGRDLRLRDAKEANVASRISAKLLAYGKVNRASLPLNLVPVHDQGNVEGKPSSLSGLAVVGVNPGLLGYEVLKDQIIISIDGVATPTTTDWLIAMERAWSRGRKTVACEITTGLGESVRVAEVYFEDGAVVNLLSPVK